MHLTEDEAKERWCRFGRFDSTAGGSYNRNYEGGPSTMCLGSECMSWRWQPLQADQPFMDAVKKRMDDSGNAHAAAVKYVRANLAELGLPDKPFRGYCGDAGKPEA